MLMSPAVHPPNHQTQMPLTSIDGVRYRKVIDNLGLPVMFVAPLPRQAMIKACQAWTLKGSHPQDVCEEDCTACCSEAS